MPVLNAATLFGAAGCAKQSKTAIALAHFGTTVPSGLKSLTAISQAVREAYPGVEARITFILNIVRSIWRKCRSAAEKWLERDEPPEILSVKNIIQTLGDLSEDGYRDIVVKPSHIFHMEESTDLENYVGAIASIATKRSKWRPFNRIVLGRPVLGAPGDNHDYHQDVAKAAAAGEMVGDGKDSWLSILEAMASRYGRYSPVWAKIRNLRGSLSSTSVMPLVIMV